MVGFRRRVRHVARDPKSGLTWRSRDDRCAGRGRSSDASASGMCAGRRSSMASGDSGTRVRSRRNAMRLKHRRFLPLTDRRSTPASGSRSGRSCAPSSSGLAIAMHQPRSSSATFGCISHPTLSGSSWVSCGRATSRRSPSACRRRVACTGRVLRSVETVAPRSDTRPLAARPGRCRRRPSGTSCRPCRRRCVPL